MPNGQVSVLILTFNEETCIRDSINSVSWSDEIVILDSYSTDNTLQIVREFANIVVYKRIFDDFSSQRNFGLHNIEYKNDWVLLLDADEKMTTVLKDEIFDCIGKISSENINVMAFRRKTFFLDKSLLRNSLYNVWLERVVKPGMVKYTGTVHEKLEFKGKSIFLKESLLHYPFNKGIENWIKRRNNYSTLYADLELKNRSPVNIKVLFFGNPINSRKELNKIFRHMPLRWLVFFIYNFFVKFCFLDGYRGIYMIILETYYEMLIVLKIKERKNHHV
ncbi:MAG: glycosyltransferase family 2 protein [Candidatus Electrothrix sp. AR1]|nr:glycosyltransferase family 2 protein [Candidatus Electrothrix sp. AR1]